MSSSISSTETNPSTTSINDGFVLLTRGPTELRAFLKTAVRATAALTELHGKDLIHRNIRRTTILIHPESGEVRLAGMRDAPQDAKAPSDSAEVLAYTSPEQTEGMKRPVD